VSLYFADSAGNKIGSTKLGQQVLSAAVGEIDPTLAGEILAEREWRKTYGGYYAKAAACEFSASRSALMVAQAGSRALENSVRTEAGALLYQEVLDGWRDDRAQVDFVAIAGGAEPQYTNVETSREHIGTLPGHKLGGYGKFLVRTNLAEPGVAIALDKLSKTLPAARVQVLQSEILVAIAGGGEYAPTRHWLDWGGTVAVIARQRPQLWQELIERARSSAGTLIVPVLRSKLKPGQSAADLSDQELATVAGLDLLVDYRAAAAFISTIARHDARHITIGVYAYAPGAEHIKVQAAQHAIIRAASIALPKTRMGLSWLGTPTDSFAAPASFVQDIDQRFATRKITTKLRDAALATAGLKKNSFTKFTNAATGEPMVVVDPTSNLQGSSYALAKRTQRYDAYLAAHEGRPVAYLVAPPARTASVLDYKVLNATYAGAPALGLHPFGTEEAVGLEACLLLASLIDQQPAGPISPDIYLDSAVHAGLWRTIYGTAGLFKAATILGYLPTDDRHSPL
jgi:hypothetical protein